jgi:hypothetical protein
MNPREPKPGEQPERQKPETTKSATRMGFFAVPIELVGAVLMIGIGVRFVTVANQSDIIGYVLFVIAAVLIIDAIRRLRRITTGKEKY